MNTPATREYSLRSLQDIYALAEQVAQQLPESELYNTAIYELLINAVEHGHLGIGYMEKAELILNGAWEKEVLRRLALPENAGKTVSVTITYLDDQCRLTIADKGAGFNWREFMQMTPMRLQPNGRGLLIVRNAGFESILFNETGNTVTCVAKRTV